MKWDIDWTFENGDQKNEYFRWEDWRREAVLTPVVIAGPAPRGPTGGNLGISLRIFVISTGDLLGA